MHKGGCEMDVTKRARKNGHVKDGEQYDYKIEVQKCGSKRISAKTAVQKRGVQKRCSKGGSV